jgi:hypothetical protein
MVTELPIPQRWPDALKVQLKVSQSHSRVMIKLGLEKTEIGIFEVMSRAKLPPKLPRVMKQLKRSNFENFQNDLGLKVQNLESLEGFALISIILTLRLESNLVKDGQLLRNLIEDCVEEVMSQELLVHDIVTAARTMARLENSEKYPKKAPLNPESDQEFKFKEKIEFFEDRPIDWKNNHWWSGE